MSSLKGSSAAAIVAPRFDVEMSAKFREEGNETWQESEVVNVSASGMCICVRKSLEPGIAVEVHIESVNAQKQRTTRIVKARVIWSRSGKAGMRFITSRG